MVGSTWAFVLAVAALLIQNTQNRDAKALHLKIDELLRATHGARNSMIDLAKLSDPQLKRLEKHFLDLCEAGNPEDAPS